MILGTKLYQTQSSFLTKKDDLKINTTKAKLVLYTWKFKFQDFRLLHLDSITLLSKQALLEIE